MHELRLCLSKRTRLHACPWLRVTFFVAVLSYIAIVRSHRRSVGFLVFIVDSFVVVHHMLTFATQHS